jgi:hypothetical protein
MQISQLTSGGGRGYGRWIFFIYGAKAHEEHTICKRVKKVLPVAWSQTLPAIRIKMKEDFMK